MIYEANDHPRHAIGTLLAQSNPERPLAKSSVIYHCANDLQVFLSDTGKYLLFHYMPGNVDINLSKKDRMDEKTILPVLDKSSQALIPESRRWAEPGRESGIGGQQRTIAGEGRDALQHPTERSAGYS